MDLNLKGKKVVVAGGSRGVGRAVVSAMAAEGCVVHYCARSLSSDALLDQRQIIGEVVDFLDAAAFSSWINRIGDFDIFIANISAMSGDWAVALKTDVIATVHAVETVVPYLVSSTSPAITYIGSKASSIAIPGFEAYAASKAAMNHYMKSKSKALIASGIRVNVVSPGDIFENGGFWDVIKSRNPEAFRAKELRSPFGRLARPDEIAKVVTFISSPAASYISGSNILVDGGMTEHVQS